MSTVETLTRVTEFRRSWGAFAAAALLGVVAPAGQAAAADWQSVESIESTAADFAAAQLDADGEEIRAEAGELDGRLRMTRCEKPLSAFLPNGTGNGSRLIVGVRCEGDKPWKVYVPVRIARFGDVLVVTRALPRGHLLSEADLRTERRDLAARLQSYITEFSQLPGRRLKRSVVAGTMLTHAMVDAEKIIRRGQKVTLVVEDGGMQIRMAGTALSDGAMDQRIRVENASSRRVVEGIVRSTEIVEIMLN